MSGVKRALRQFTFGQGKTAGRNSSGRITSFHRGGGAKRLQRVIDLKRNTSSSIGIVERIEYDPNRSSRIALVRWLNGIHPPPQRRTPAASESSTSAASPRVLQIDPSSTANDTRGVFGLSPMLPQLHAGAASGKVFISAFSSKTKEDKTKSDPLPLGLPRIAVAAARPAFFGTRTHLKGEDEKLEIRNWKKNSNVWEHRNKRKAAISWHNIA
ncbi:large ribosomal subunit protein uL2m-like [Vicia villosa]|uniref:large ribosomal subunit protein uL2m-like n=1 Tax=Vicia villosa TaxID=3911 RepID=UPI00273C5C36|nr:large ribosomal subunit protein uL2m-like [Vicia villosa]